ncbi:DUF3084 domain-containing protein [uncultured Fretibacterium sp.]|uniref:DUF3084 domain-containing protein n=1 Tax=uncultured Fretibacterium sp. TaxID=1678694 RepID=UPI0026395ED0|nr:DUF3084 domain-containing protein [uncultured Fretibacterium sp.]
MNFSGSGANWFLILSLILGSAALAFLGDVLGFRYGKQRISIFGLRPKYTSRLITAITGGVITVIVLGVLSAFSQDVRTALFSMNYIQQQLLDLRLQLNQSQEIADQAQEALAEQQARMQVTTASLDLARLDLDSLRNDRLLLEQEKSDLAASVQGLRDESEQLKQALHTMRSGSIALSANVLLAQGAFEPGTSEEEARKGLEDLKQRARVAAQVRMSELLPSTPRSVSVTFDPEEEASLLKRIEDAPDRLYVRAISRENVAFGEEVGVRFEVGRSLLLYSDGDVIYRRVYNAQAQDFDAEEALHSFLRDLKVSAIHEGVLPDPATNNVGTLRGEEFFDAVETLRSIHTPVIINGLASGDIHTEGPVNLRLSFQE